MCENKRYESFCRWECHKGFYNEEGFSNALGEIDYSDRFECPDDDEGAFIFSSAEYLLRGECGCFALALQDIFGYTPYVIESADDKGFHAFCLAKRNGRFYYIDARGVTTNFDEFMLVASEFVRGEYIIKVATKEDAESWKRGEFYEYAFSFSKALINDCREYYTV